MVAALFVAVDPPAGGELVAVLVGAGCIWYLASRADLVNEGVVFSPVELGSFLLAVAVGPSAGLVTFAACAVASVWQELHLPPGVRHAQPHRVATSVAAQALASLVCAAVVAAGPDAGWSVVVTAPLATLLGVTTVWSCLNLMILLDDFDHRIRFQSVSQLTVIAAWCAVAMWAWTPSSPLTALTFVVPCLFADQFNRLSVTSERLLEEEAECRRLLELALAAQDQQRVEIREAIMAGPLRTIMTASAINAARRADISADNGQLGTVLRAAADDLSEALNGFAPPDANLDAHGFQTVLVDAVRRRCGGVGPLLTVQCDTVLAVDVRVLRHLFRLALEGACNAFQHNPPGTEVLVALHVSADDLLLIVYDNGPGVRVEEMEARRRAGHLGVAIMRERAGWLGGTFELRPSAVGGTVLRVVAPVPRGI